MLQTRARTTHENRGHARATQQTHARARARVHKEPNDARANARGIKQCARARALTRNQTMGVHARARHTVSLFARAETLCQLICPYGELM